MIKMAEPNLELVFLIIDFIIATVGAYLLHIKKGPDIAKEFIQIVTVLFIIVFLCISFN